MLGVAWVALSLTRALLRRPGPDFKRISFTRILTVIAPSFSAAQPSPDPIAHPYTRGEEDSRHTTNSRRVFFGGFECMWRCLEVRSARWWPLPMIVYAVWWVTFGATLCQNAAYTFHIRLFGPSFWRCLGASRVFLCVHFGRIKRTKKPFELIFARNFHYFSPKFTKHQNINKSTSHCFYDNNNSF